MKDKLNFKRPNYVSFVDKGSIWHEEYKDWIKENPKFKQFTSKNRRAYYFILKTKGRFMIKKIRTCVLEMDDVFSIIKTPWIKLPEED